MAMRRLYPPALCLVLSLASINARAQGDANTQSAAESIALENSISKTPIVLEISQIPDVAECDHEARLLRNDSSYRSQRTTDFEITGAKNISFDGRVLGSVGRSKRDQTMFWLLKSDVIRFREYKTTSKDTFDCPVLNAAKLEELRKISPQLEIGTPNRMRMPVAKKVLGKWTYRNIYTTPMPQKGDVRVFAGVISYTIEPTVPSILNLSINGSGTWRVKMYYDPDKGKWTTLESENKEPEISLIATGSPAIIHSVAVDSQNAEETVYFMLYGEDLSVARQEFPGSVEVTSDGDCKFTIKFSPPLNQMTLTFDFAKLQYYTPEKENGNLHIVAKAPKGEMFVSDTSPDKMGKMIKSEYNDWDQWAGTGPPLDDLYWAEKYFRANFCHGR